MTGKGGDIYGDKEGLDERRKDQAGVFPIEAHKNKLQTVESLIKNAAFMAVSLEELQEIINEEGYTVEYQNGANQSGTKQSDAVKTHIAMTKNHAAIIKQLCDLVPPEKKKESRLQALRDE